MLQRKEEKREVFYSTCDDLNRNVKNDFIKFDIMNIEAEKLSLIQWLAQLSDERLIARLKLIQTSRSDWWDTIEMEERIEIERGLAQAKNNEVTAHDEVMEKFEKWL